MEFLRKKRATENILFYMKIKKKQLLYTDENGERTNPLVSVCNIDFSSILLLKKADSVLLNEK